MKLKITSCLDINHIFKVVSGLMPKKSANPQNLLRQRRRQFQLGRFLRRVASVTASPKEAGSAISEIQPQTLSSLGLTSLPSVEDAVTVYYEEVSDEDDEIDNLLLDDYVLLDLEQGAPVLTHSENLVEVSIITIVSNSFCPSSSSF